MWHFLLLSAVRLYGDADLVFQQDFAPVHGAKTTSNWFVDTGITVIDWPLNSPDLNPIDFVWGSDIRYCTVKKKMSNTRPMSIDELKATIKATWASLARQQWHRLISPMPCCSDAVICAKVAPTIFIFCIYLYIYPVYSLALGRHVLGGHQHSKCLKQTCKKEKVTRVKVGVEWKIRYS